MESTADSSSVTKRLEEELAKRDALIEVLLLYVSFITYVLLLLFLLSDCMPKVFFSQIYVCVIIKKQICSTAISVSLRFLFELYVCVIIK